MYCKSCGYRLKTSTGKCPKCKSTIDQEEYCSGFWDIIENKPVADNPKERPETGSERKSREPVIPGNAPLKKTPYRVKEKNTKETNKLVIPLAVVSVILLMIVIYTMVSLLNVKSTLKEHIANSTELTEYHNLKNSYDKLENDYDELSTELDDLKNDYQAAVKEKNLYEQQLTQAEEKLNNYQTSHSIWNDGNEDVAWDDNPLSPLRWIHELKDYINKMRSGENDTDDAGEVISTESDTSASEQAK